MTTLKAHKVVASLPTTLEPNAIYAVRVGVGFDMYVADSTGTMAHKINAAQADAVIDGGGASTVYLPSQLIDGGGANG